MKLEDLDWTYASVFNEIDRHAVFGTRTCIWRIIQFKDGTYNIHHRQQTHRAQWDGWDGLDTIGAQCVLMHLTGNPESNSNG